MLRRLFLGCLLLVIVGCGRSTNNLIAQSRDADPARRMHAIQLLQKKTKESAVVVPRLIEMLQDENAYVRRDAARALGTFGTDATDAITPLSAKLKDPEPGVRRAVEQALKAIDPNHPTK